MRKRTWSRKFETNILKVYHQARAEEREEGLKWYATAHADAQAIADRHGISLEQAAGVIASISPGLSWGLNVTQADRFVGAFKAGQKLPMIGAYGLRNMAKALGILQGGDPLYYLNADSGPKTRAFYLNILSPETSEEVTVDRHAKCAAFMAFEDREKLGIVRIHEYAYIAKHYRIIAKRYGLLPHQLQAIVWITWKRMIEERMEFNDPRTES